MSVKSASTRDLAQEHSASEFSSQRTHTQKTSADQNEMNPGEPIPQEALLEQWSQGLTSQIKVDSFEALSYSRWGPADF